VGCDCNDPGTIGANVLAVIEMYRWQSHAPLGLAAGITGMLAFFSMLVLAQEPGTWKITEATMRTAIAAAFVAEYLALLSMVAFAISVEKNLSGLAQTLVSDFTKIVGVVIAFYFGASAFVDGRRLSAAREADDTVGTSVARPGASTV